MLRRIVYATLPLVIILLLPILLRRTDVGVDPDADRLIIVTPHNEAIRHEFEAAFRRHYQAKHGRAIAIDWRTPGGTSDIVRYLRSEYTAAFRHAWNRAQKPWSFEVQNAFLDRRTTLADATPAAWAARRAFLESDIGVGIDLFFGGGQFDFGRLADEGVLVPCGVRTRTPELFEDAAPVLIQAMGGEVWYDPDDRYYGACLSAFGICTNLDRLAELGLAPPTGQPPTTWEDLGSPRLFGQLGVADPSKSGSINKCFEMLIQQQIAATIAAGTARGEGEDAAALIGRGWDQALLLIRKIGGNARYFTFGASRVPVDVAQGSVAAGMAIDFYGRSQAEWEHRHNDRQIMAYVTPEGGSSISADPIGLLRGAPHRAAAHEFIDFVLSRPGQQLWNYRAGTPGGPERYALRRLPVRRDLYTAADRALMSDANARPFELAARFVYHPEWTARLFGLIRVLLRVMIIDCHHELRLAWQAIIEAGGPDAVPEAMNALRRLPFAYAEADDVARELGNSERRLKLTREWGVFFRAAYRDAERLARASSPRSNDAVQP